MIPRKASPGDVCFSDSEPEYGVCVFVYEHARVWSNTIANGNEIGISNDEYFVYRYDQPRKKKSRQECRITEK